MRKGGGTITICYLVVFLTVIIIAPTSIAGCLTPNVFLEMPLVRLRLSDEVRQEEFTVRLANDRTTRMAGYQKVCPIDAKGTALLFVFPYAVDASFHMNNVFVDLDIVFFNSDGVFINHELMTYPKQGQSSQLYHSKERAQYALELPAGKWIELGFTQSVTLDVLK